IVTFLLVLALIVSSVPAVLAVEEEQPPVQATAVSVAIDTPTDVRVGVPVQLTATVTMDPSDAAFQGELEWTSFDTDTASLNSTGLFTPKKAAASVSVTVSVKDNPSVTDTKNIAIGKKQI